MPAFLCGEQKFEEGELSDSSLSLARVHGPMMTFCAVGSLSAACPVISRTVWREVETIRSMEPLESASEALLVGGPTTRTVVTDARDG